MRVPFGFIKSAGGGIQTPVQIFGANCIGHLKDNFTQATGVWVDESATAVNTSQANAGLRPTATTINGHTAVHFDGTQGLNWGGDREVLVSGDATIFGVFRTGSLAGPGVLIGKLYSGIAWWVGGSNASAKHIVYDIVNANDASGAISNANLEDNAVHYFVAVRDGSAHKLYIDSVLQTDTGAFVGAIPGTAEFLAIGCSMSTSEGTTQWRWNGDAMDLGMVDRKPTAGELTKIHAYLSNRSGV